MPTRPSEPPRPLPDRPNLRHLKHQARDLLKSGVAATLSQALLAVARSYGFTSWPALKAHLDTLAEVGRLKAAIDANDVAQVAHLMTRNPSLHCAALGYGKNGPLTWVAECRVPWEPPRPERLEMARWMIAHGSDVHQGGDGPLMRASLRDDRIPMMALLVAHGADVNARWSGHFPIIFAPCETLQPGALEWLLRHGANANCADPDHGIPRTALDYAIATYSRTPRQAACIDLLVAAGATTKYALPAVLDLLRGRLDRFAERLDDDPSLVHRRFRELDFGATAHRGLTLAGATLLHVAAEYGSVEAARLLLDRGADVNASAEVDANGVGGQTPIFHAATQFDDFGFGVAELLIDRGADLSIRVKVPGSYERPGEAIEATPLEYASLFPGDGAETPTVALLTSRFSKR